MTGIVGSIALGSIVGKARGFLGSIPWQIWAVAAAILLLGIGSCVHGHKVKAFGKTQFTAGRAAADADWKKAFDKARADALAWKAKAEANAVKVSQLLRESHEQTVRSNAALSIGLLRGGSGAASCRPINRPVIAAPTSGREPTAPVANAAGPAMPPEDWAAVPWSWLVTRGQEHDDCLSESRTWREFYKQLPAALSP